MEVRAALPAEREQTLELMERALRPGGAATRVQDDFPVALRRDDRDGLLVAVEGGRILSCLSSLVRPVATSLGVLRIAGVGSVATEAEWRGRGLSSRLQAELLARLRAAEVPLAVLWSDRPELYAGRGFRPAGCELHVDLARWRPGPEPALDGGRARDYRPDDMADVERLYAGHPWRTLRRRGDAVALYGMPGTRGLVLEGPDGAAVAYVFCGKGLDFPGYVVEWGGPVAGVLRLLAHARARAGARRVLVPAGAEGLAEALLAGGADVFALPSGLWAVLRPDLLARAAAAAGLPAPEGAAALDARAWLGEVGQEGDPRPGPLRLAVWGFDSV